MLTLQNPGEGAPGQESESDISRGECDRLEASLLWQTEALPLREIVETQRSRLAAVLEQLRRAEAGLRRGALRRSLHAKTDLSRVIIRNLLLGRGISPESIMAFEIGGYLSPIELDGPGIHPDMRGPRPLREIVAEQRQKFDEAIARMRAPQPGTGKPVRRYAVQLRTGISHALVCKLYQGAAPRVDSLMRFEEAGVISRFGSQRARISIEALQD